MLEVLLICVVAIFQDVLVHVTRGSVHINGSPQAAALVKQSLPEQVPKAGSNFFIFFAIIKRVLK